MRNRKLSNIINLTLESDTIKHGNKYTRVLEISDFEKISEIINSIGQIDQFKLEDNFKLIINFKEQKYYLLQTTSEFLDSVDDDELRSEFIMELYKRFYSFEKLCYDEKMLKKNKKLKQEIAPYKFKVNSDYIEEDRGYCIVNIIESINKIQDVKTFCVDSDIWLSVDFNKLNQEKMLNIIAKMEESKFEKVAIDMFIKKHIPELKEQLKNEDVVQCELKILHFNDNIDTLNADNTKLVNKLRCNGINIFQVKERLNIIKAFKSSIYPYVKLEVTHSLKKNDFIRLIGGEI